MNCRIFRLICLLIFFSISTSGFSQLVTNQAQLISAISAATPGTTILLADGTWNNVFIKITKNATSEAPITIKAQNQGSVFMTGNSRVYMEGSYLIVSGLIFRNPANLVLSGSTIEPVFELSECDHCKVLQNKIENYNGLESQKTLTFKWVLVDGQYNEIAYNSFIEKYGIGSIINDNRNTSEPDYLSIHHNYFADRKPINGVNDDNDQDAIRIGNSATSLNNSFTEVYSNYFYNFFGEIEIISNKSGQNKYYNNTFRKYSGCLTLRHGNNCEVFGNYFFAEKNLISAGIRVIGEGHKIFNNYIDGVSSKKEDGSSSNATGGINVTNGRLNSALNGYFQVKNTQIVHNTFVNCDYGLRIGTKVSSDLDQAPLNLIVANNIMYNTDITPIQTITTPIGTYTNAGNITNLAASALTSDSGFFRLTSGSAPVDASVGNYIFAKQDILGENRNNIYDCGAEELGSNGTNLPIENADVGVTIGFGANVDPTPQLSIFPSIINVGKQGGTFTLDVLSDVNWVVSTSDSWFQSDVTAGSGNKTLTITVAENTTGAVRIADINIDEELGGSGLTQTCFVNQINTSFPREIPIIGATSKGMQVKPDISEINAYNDDLTNYWTGDPDTEPEVSITFDLGCVHELTEIGIHFWKAEERTTTFSIALANEPFGPFITAINAATSAAVGATVLNEQLFSLAGNESRYIKFIGIGNSSSSNWTSIANVNIYGDPECKNATNVVSLEDVTPSIEVYPSPASDVLTISSKSGRINKIKIYNSIGQLILTQTHVVNNTVHLDISSFTRGLYYIKTDDNRGASFLVTNGQ